MQQRLIDTILTKHNTIIKTVVSNAIKRMEPFGDHHKADHGLGLWPIEYKAAVFHGGIWQGRRVKFDWNRKIASRLLNGTADYMSKVFTAKNSYAIQAIRNAEQACTNAYVQLNRTMEFHAAEAGVNDRAWAIVKHQHRLGKEVLADAFVHARQEIRDAPSAAIKDLFIDIVNGMQQGYGNAQMVSRGNGARAAMSAEVLQHISQGNGQLFNRALKKIEKGLKMHVEMTMQQLNKDLEDLAVRTKTDYENAFAQLDGVVLTTSDPVKNQLRGQLLASGLVSYDVTSICKEAVQDEADAHME